MSTTEPWRMPHWLTPVCEDHPVSQPISRWVPWRSQRCSVGTSPECSARSSTTSASPSICTKTTPGTSVEAAFPARRRGPPAHRGLEPGVVVEGEERGDDGRDDGEADDDQQRRPPSGEVHPGEEIEHEADDDDVEDDGAEAERDDGQRHDDEGECGPHDGVDETDDEAGEQRLPPLVDGETVEQAGEHPQGEGAGDRDEDGAPHDDAERRAVADRAELGSRPDGGGHVTGAILGEDEVLTRV